jgi:putative colanic acid biosynthesis UDP-glucose lipid carrier transferase
MWIQRLVNATVIVVTLLGLALWRDGVIGAHYRYMAIISVLVMLIVYHILGVHRRFENYLGGIQHLARAWGTVIIIVGWVGFITKTSEVYSRQVIFLWVVLAFLFQMWLFPSFYWIYNHLKNKDGAKPIPSIVIGTEGIAQHLTKSINRNVWLPDQVIGVVAISEQDKESWPLDNPPALGTIAELADLISRHEIRRVYIAVPLRLTRLIEDIQNLLFSLNIDIIWAPDIFSLHLLNPSVKEVAGVPLLTLSETPLMAGGPAFIKNCMDKCFAFLGIIVLSPVLLITALAIKLNSPGPIIFKQQRHGWDGRVIEVWKFRSMYIHQPENGHVEQAKLDDPRITAVGRRIRQTSVDELPQLFNVLQGTMSLVGPRPHAVEHNDYYSDKVGAYLARHRIKPGITGLAQINGCRGETETLDKMEERIQYDLEYINHWSPWLDFKILLQTPYALLTEKAH